jgi:heme exporter protein CcmC
VASWQWFHRLGSPRWFYEKTESWVPWLAVFAIWMIVTGCIWGLAFTPPDAKQGNSFRILYIHAPTSMLAMSGYYLMAISGAVGLIWRMKLAFMVMKSAAAIGAMLTFLGLFTGAVWGKPTWGTWWEWDARITSMLVLFFLYLGIIALQEAYRDQDAADKTSAILALVGTVNIPIIYKSVDWWYTLHQPATFKIMEKSTIAPSMAYPFVWMILAFYVTFAWLLIMRTRVEILKRERRTTWVQELARD